MFGASLESSEEAHLAAGARVEKWAVPDETALTEALLEVFGGRGNLRDAGDDYEHDHSQNQSHDNDGEPRNQLRPRRDGNENQVTMATTWARRGRITRASESDDDDKNDVEDGNGGLGALSRRTHGDPWRTMDGFKT